MEKSRFFNSISGDRKYLAEDFAAYFSNIFSNGVFLHQTNALKVSPSSGLTVSIAAGKAVINGYNYENTAALTKTAETVTANRIDRVVIRLDMTNRQITVAIKKGTAATSPTAPALVQNADIWELGIADINLAAGTTTITAAMITDLRANSTYCGGVTMLVDRDEILGDITNTIVQFTQASSRANIATGEKADVLFGKIKKYFADLKALAFLATVGSSQIDGSAVTEAKIASSAVTTAKINNSAVTTAKINNGAVTTDKLGSGAVTSEKIDLASLRNLLYPVGALKLTTNNTNPSNYLGGTWVAFGSGRVLVGVDTSQTEFNTTEKTGGEKTHTLTAAELAAHKHAEKACTASEQGTSQVGYYVSGARQGSTNGYRADAMGAVGGILYTAENEDCGQAHNNLQPYITCYIWKRTA